MRKFILLVAVILLSNQSLFSQVPSYVPSNGLVGFWPFSGNANDASGNGNNGTVNGASLTTDRNGVANSAYNFSGGSNISIPMTSALHNLPNRTFSCWYFANGSQSGGRIFETTYPKGGIAIYNGNTLDAWYNNGTNECNVTNINSGTLNQWHNLVYVTNSVGLGTIYIDGILINSRNGVLQTASTNWLSNFLRFGIGAQGESFNGKIDDVGIWNRALTAQEISSIYYQTTSTTCLPDYVPTNGLVGYWPFCGNANDASTNGNNGTVNGASLTTDRNGVANSAYSFDGLGNYIQVPHSSSISITGDITMSAWVKTNGSNGLNYQTIISKRQTYWTWEYAMALSYHTGIIHDTKLLSARALGMGNGEQVWSTTPYTINNWENWVVTISNNQMKIYRNGVLDKTQSFSLVPVNQVCPLLFGKNTLSDNSEQFKGNIDDIGIWNRALTAQEISNMYISCTPPEAPTGALTQTFCVSPAPTIASLSATGTGIQWYAAATGGTALATTTALVSGTTYYASQTLNACESTTRLAVTVTLNDPQITASETTICSGTPVTLSASTTATVAQNGNLPINLQTGLVGYWPFNGNANDESGNSNNGNFVGASTLTTDRFGNSNKAFQAGTSYVTCPSTVFQFGRNDNFSISIWFTKSTNNGGRMVSNESPEGNFRIGQIGNLDFSVQFGDYLNFSINDNNWHNLIYTYAGRNEKVYIDGLLSISNFDNSTEVLSYGNPFTIGAKAAPSYDKWNGKIDDVGIWNRALTQQEVQQLTFTSSYLWSTGATTASINPSPTATTTYWCDVTVNGVTCRKTITITVNPNIAPAFTQVAAICNGATLAALPTTSNDGVTGNWSPALNNTATTTYTFTPTTGQCATTATMTITVNTTPTPTGTASQTFCATPAPTVADLTATGIGVQWYAAANGGTALATTTALVNGTTYYASQTLNACESTTRLAVTVTLSDPQITASATTICNGTQVTLTATSGVTSNFYVGSIGPSGGYVFYDQGSVINGWRYLEAAPSDNGINDGIGCYCSAIPNTSTLIGTGKTNTLNWINSGCNGAWLTTSSSIQINGNNNWFIPSKDEVNLMYTNLKLNNLGNFQNVQYWSSSPASYGSCGINGGVWVQNFTNGNFVSEARNGYGGAGNLRLVRQFSTGTPFATYLWSTGATTATINPTPTATTTYWCDVTVNGVTCRKSVTITVNSTPTPTGAASQTFCATPVPTVASLTATGTGIQWYATANGGTALATTTALVNGTTYYASQTLNACESTSRLAVAVTLNDPQITTSATAVCSGTPVTLSASTTATAAQNGNLPINLQTGLVGYWPFNGNANDVSGNANNGTVNGATLTIDRFGNVDSAYNFNSNFIQVPANNSLNNPQGSISFWLNTTNNNLMIPIKKNNYSGAVNEQYSFALNYSNLLSLKYNSSCQPSFGWTSFGGNNPILTNGNWHMVTATYSSVVKIYIDGTLISSTSAPSSSIDLCSGDLQFGREWSSFNNYFIGKLDDIAIYNRALSQSEITQLYNSNQASYLWSTGETTATINPTPTATTTYWCDVTVNGLTCRKTMTITVNPNITPAFTQVAAICNGATLAALPTTSNDGVTGTWSPALNNTATTTYTFTPTAGQCATTATMTITVNPNITPAFTQVAAICGNPIVNEYYYNIGAYSPLGSCTEGNNYNWTVKSNSPLPIGTAVKLTNLAGHTSNELNNYTCYFISYDFGYSRPPDAFVATSFESCSACQTTSTNSSLLPTTSSNGITGTWSPALNNSATTTYTFTPTAGQCATTATMTITVNTTPTPTGTATQTFCATPAPTVASLTATGTGIQWYATANGGTALATTTALVNGTTYYASQTLNACESTTRLAVTVTLNDPQITASATTVCSGTPVTLSASTTATAAQNGNLPTNLQTGLVGYWPFNGNANDLSGNSKNGTVNGATLTTDRFGNLNSAYNFNTYPNYIQFPEISNTLGSSNSATTISIWSKSNHNYPDGVMIHSASPGFQYQFARIEENSINKVKIYNRNPSTNNEPISTESTNSSDWNHIVAVIDGINGNYKLYINGILTPSMSFNFDPSQSYYSNSRVWQIGAISFDQSYHQFTGKIDDLSIFNRALSQSEITQLYTAAPTYLWSTGETTATINPSPTSTTTYWCDVTVNGVTCRKTMTITVNPNITPAFMQVAAICNGATLAALPTTSNDGVTGTWSPALNNTATTTYTFTPTAGQCATTATMTITVNTTPTPTGAASQTFCATPAPTVASLTATGTGVQWYAAANGGTALDTTTALVNGTTYYASQTLNACESTTRLAVTVILNDPQITASATTICSGTSVNLSITGGSFSGAIGNTQTPNPWPNPSSFDAGIISLGQFGRPTIFSTSFWINPESTQNGVSIILDCSHGGSSNWVLQSFGDNNYTWGNLTVSLSPNVWQHVLLTYNNGVKKCFVNGQLTATTNQTINYSGIPNLNLGNWPEGGRRFNGKIDELYVTYNILEISNFIPLQTITNILPNTMGLWHFDEGSGSTSLNSNNSTNINIGSWYWTSRGQFSISYLWSTGETTATINPTPTATTTYWCDVTVNGVTCRKTMTITVNPNITPAFTQVAPICNGATLAALPTTSTNSITGTWSPVLNNTATTTYTFTPTAGQCATTATMTITVNPNITPAFTQVAAICNGATLSALPTTSNEGVTGSWSPAINNTTTTTYTFTPTAGQCSTTATMTITVNPNIAPTFTQVAPICNGATLSALPTTSTNSITGTWSPALDNTATTTYTFTPTVGLCATTATMTITVNPNITPAFSQVPAICNGATLAALPTTSFNNITGTWSPALNNTATTTYTFTPTVGLCATTATMIITVNPIITPAFTQVAAICSGADLSPLPTSSTNGINGTWSPALNYTATTTYTFTPIARQCATTATMTITVNPNITPTFTQVAAICAGATLAALPTTSNNGYTGTWSPAMNNTATTTYTFTPTAGLCATTATMTVTVNPLPLPPTGTITQTFCANIYPTLQNIVVTPANVNWFSSLTSSTPLPITTNLPVGSTTYYASQFDAVTGCSSNGRLAVLATVLFENTPSTLTDQTFCSTDLKTLADIKTNGLNIVWYSSASGGTPLLGSYVLTSSQSLYAAIYNATTGCESPIRQMVQITIINCQLVANNLLTLNDNSLNDNLKIENIENFPINQIEIYNRFGELVWKTEYYNNDSNTFKGRANVSGVYQKDSDLPTGTYYFLLKYYDSYRGKYTDLKSFLYINNNN